MEVTTIPMTNILMAETQYSTSYLSGGDVRCLIKPLADGVWVECVGDSIEDLKDQVVCATKGLLPDSLFDRADLVCEKDGYEVLEMASLREHLKKGHDILYLVGPNSPGDERARNVDLVTRLFKELTGEADVLDIAKMKDDIYRWAGERRTDLQAIVCCSLDGLVAQLDKPREDVRKFRRQVDKILEATSLSSTLGSMDDLNCTN